MNKPFKSFKNLTIGTHYVESFRRVSTNFGDRIRVDFLEFYMYLPDRFSRLLTDGLLTELNNGDSDVVMTYSGKDSIVQNRLLLDFDAIRLDLDADVF